MSLCAKVAWKLLSSVLEKDDMSNLFAQGKVMNILGKFNILFFNFQTIVYFSELLAYNLSKQFQPSNTLFCEMKLTSITYFIMDFISDYHKIKSVVHTWLQHKIIIYN